jgi:hypothetical protein
MNVLEREEFLDAMKETAMFVKLTQAALQRARSQCHGEVYEQINLMAKRAYELSVKAEWLRYAVYGGIELPIREADSEGRRGPDRRAGIDRRIQGLQQQSLPVASLEAAL